MKRILFLLTFITSSLLCFSQASGIVFYEYKELDSVLNKEEKILLHDCSKILGVSLDSMKSAKYILDNERMKNFKYNVLFVSRSTEPIIDLDTKEMKETIISNYFVNPKLETPKYLFFLRRMGNISQIIIQVYY